MFLSRPNRRFPPNALVVKRAACLSARRRTLSHAHDAGAFVAALLLLATLFYVSRPSFSYTEHSENCAESHGSAEHCAGLAPQRPH